QTLCRFDERLFEDLTEASRTSCRCLKNVIRHAGVAARNAIQNGIERPHCVFWITVFAGFDESLSLAHYLAFDMDDHQFFRSWIKELARHCGSIRIVGQIKFPPDADRTGNKCLAQPTGGAL